MLFNLLQTGLFLAALILLGKPLGAYMAHVYLGERTFLTPVLRPVELFIYRLAKIDYSSETNWKKYAISLLIFNTVGIILLYVLQRVQFLLPLNPQALGTVNPDLAFNTAVSFGTNTNWQSYSGEMTMSYLTQMLGMCAQNFLSAATGMAVAIALFRGLARHTASTVGNYYVDITRGVLYILLPLSFLLSLALVTQGVVQTLESYQYVTLLQPATDSTGQAAGQQLIAVGPAASQIAIKQLGTNGGGFFNTNSAHPFENPTPLTNFLEMLAILIIPASLCYTFGKMVGDTRQGWAILAVMTILFSALLSVTLCAEQAGNPALSSLGVDQSPGPFQAGGNMEGKEVRFGVANSAIWATATTAASNGSVNTMVDSFTPLGGLIPMWLMQLGEVVYGGAGSGMYGILAFVIIAVFIAGLMIGRTPEYLGKKIEAYEMKMACIIVLTPVLVVLLGTAAAVLVPGGRQAVFNPGPHGFSEILYAISSASNNNGSAFAGLSSNNLFYNLTLGIAMLIGRYWLIIPTLAVAGSMVRKKKIPVTAGTLPTHSPLFISWLITVIIIVGALSFLPAVSLGPLVEQLMLK